MKNKIGTRNECSSDKRKESVQSNLEKVARTQIKVTARDGITILC